MRLVIRNLVAIFNLLSSQLEELVRGTSKYRGNANLREALNHLNEARRQLRQLVDEMIDD
jgi:hypothetical protein